MDAPDLGTELQPVLGEAYVSLLLPVFVAL